MVVMSESRKRLANMYEQLPMSALELNQKVSRLVGGAKTVNVSSGPCCYRPW